VAALCHFDIFRQQTALPQHQSPAVSTRLGSPLPQGEGSATRALINHCGTSEGLVSHVRGRTADRKTGGPRYPPLVLTGEAFEAQGTGRNLFLAAALTHAVRLSSIMSRICAKLLRLIRAFEWSRRNGALWGVTNVDQKVGPAVSRRSHHSLAGSCGLRAKSRRGTCLSQS